MIRRLVLLFGAAVLVSPMPVPASSITGIMIYSADWTGTPIGLDPNSGAIDRGQLWRTGSDSRWHGLGVLRGLPPDSLAGALLNAPDFSVQIPLAAGEHDFTLLGEPGAMSEDDIYGKFAISLFFDGAEEPGLSLLFTPKDQRYGQVPEPNQSDILVGFSVTLLSSTAEPTYDDGRIKVTVTAVSFVPPHRFLAADRVSALAPRPSADGTSDWIGVLRIGVEGSVPDAPAGRGRSMRRLDPRSFGIIPSRPGLGGDSGASMPAWQPEEESGTAWQAAARPTPAVEVEESDEEDEEATTPTPDADGARAGAETPTRPAVTPTAPTASVPTATTPAAVETPTASDPSSATPTPAAGSKDALPTAAPAATGSVDEPAARPFDGARDQLRGGASRRERGSREGAAPTGRG